MKYVFGNVYNGSEEMFTPAPPTTFSITHYKQIGDNKRAKYFPNVAPEDGVIVIQLQSDDVNCPACHGKLIAPDIQKRRCMACHTYVALPGETVNDVIAERTNQSVYTHNLKPDQDKPVYMWYRIPGFPNSNYFKNVYQKPIPQGPPPQWEGPAVEPSW